jgi:hypothetical protein
MEKVSPSLREAAKNLKLTLSPGEWVWQPTANAYEKYQLERKTEKG